MNCHDLKVIYLPNLQTTEEKPVTILREILKWSQSIPTWQQDTIARLYVKPDLSAQLRWFMFKIAGLVQIAQIAGSGKIAGSVLKNQSGSVLTFQQNV